MKFETTHPICCISGAIQHQAGMRSVKVIVALNQQQRRCAHLQTGTLVMDGDLFQIVPALEAEFKKRLGK